MDHVRGVTDERDALRHEGARNREPEWKCPPRPLRFDLAEMQAEALFKLGMKAGVVERDDAFGFSRLLGPDDRRAVPGGIALERQDRERTSGQEMLLGTPMVIALVPHGGCDARLPVWPAMRRDAGAIA